MPVFCHSGKSVYYENGLYVYEISLFLRGGGNIVTESVRSLTCCLVLAFCCFRRLLMAVLEIRVSSVDGLSPATVAC